MKNKNKNKVACLAIIIIIMLVIIGVISLFLVVERKTLQVKTDIVSWLTMYESTTSLHYEANRAIKRSPVPATVPDKIVYYAEIFGVNTEVALRIANCESKFNPNAENLNSSATGVYQFIRKTWKSNCEGNVYNADANIICFVRMYPKHPEWWECE